jgi:colanic acid biosynthesis glycosyl transferase WcaI
MVRHPTLPSRGGGAVRRIVSEGWSLAGVLRSMAGAGIPRHDLVLSLSPSVLSVAAGSVARCGGGRHVALIHDIQSGLARGLGLVGRREVLGLMRTAERTLFNRTDGMIVLTEAMRSALRAQGVEAPIEVVPIWVDTERLRPLPRPEGPPTAVYSGSFGRKQGLALVVGMAERLRSRYPDARVVLQGAGPLEGTLRQLVAQRGLMNVEFRPLAPAEGLGRALAAGDVHLVPQDAAAAPYALPSKTAAILAAGRPFVCTAEPGSPLGLLAAESGAGVCSPPGDVAAFAEAVERLLRDPVLRGSLGRAGRDWAECHVAKDRVLPRLQAFVTGASR